MLIFLLVIAALFIIPAILGGISEKQDKNKQEQHQQDLTNQARSSMSSHRYIKQYPASCGWSLVQLADFRLAFVNNQGAFLNNEIFCQASSFENNVTPVCKPNGGAGLLEATGRYIIPCVSQKNLETYVKKVYDGIYEYKKVFYSKPSYQDHTEIYIVKKDGTYINDDYCSELVEIKENYVKLRYRDGKTAELDFNGKFLFRPFNKKVDLGGGLYRVREDGYGWGIYDKNKDKILIPCKYSEILYFKPFDLFILKPFGDGTRGFPAFAVNSKNEIVIPQKYDEISILEQKYIRVSFYNKERGCGLLSGIVNLKGEILVQPKYVNIWPSESGFMVTNGVDNARCGFVGKDGYANLEYDLIKHIYGSSWDCPTISFAGCLKPDAPYSKTYSSKPSYLIVSKNGKQGLIDLDNHIIIQNEFDEITDVKDENLFPSYFIVQKCGMYGLYDKNGIQLLPLKYKKIISHFETERSYIPLYDISDEKVYMDDNKLKKEFDRYDNYQRGKTVYFEVVLCNDKSQYLLPSGLPYHGPNKTKGASILQTTISQSNVAAPDRNSKPQIKYLFFDTETTGIPLDYNAPTTNVNNWPRLVQLSWIVTDEQCNVISTNDYIIYPDGFSIPSNASKIHGITTEKAKKDGENIITVIDSFMSDFKSATYIVGHNIAFDKKIIGAELVRLGRKDVMNSKPSLCTMESSTNYCKIPGSYGYKWPKLQELYTKLFGHEFEDAHNSMCDITATLECFKELKRIGVI